MALHNELGRQGEMLAYQFLEQMGYEVCDQNWCFDKAEVDLIVYKDGILIFVEVKTRTGNYFGEPEDFVDNRKQQLLSKAAEEYIHLMNHQGEIRFDIISITFERRGKQHELRHIIDAFWNY